MKVKLQEWTRILKQENCLLHYWLWWFVSFFYSHPDNITPDTEDPEPKPMIIGTNNVFEVGCCILYNNLSKFFFPAVFSIQIYSIEIVMF